MSSNVFPPLLSPVQCFHFIGVCSCSFQSLLSCNIYVSVSQSARKICRPLMLYFDSAMRSMYLLIIGMFSNPPTAIVSLKLSLMHRLNLLQENFEKAYKIQL